LSTVSCFDTGGVVVVAVTVVVLSE